MTVVETCRKQPPAIGSRRLGCAIAGLVYHRPWQSDPARIGVRNAALKAKGK